MQPVRQDLAFYRGDSRDIIVRLYARAAGAGRVPLVPESGEAFELEITSALAGNLHTWSTKGAGATALQITLADDATTISKHLDAQTTKAIGGRGALTWTLSRIPATGERRTYLTGVVTMLAAPQGAPGSQAFDLTVDAAASAIEVVVTEAFSGAAALVGAAVAELRGGAPASTTLKTLSDAVGAREVAAAKGQPGGYAGLGSTGATPVAQGGTGGTTAADARTNLGLGSVNNTADSAKPVSVAQGMADAGVLAAAKADARSAVRVLAAGAAPVSLTGTTAETVLASIVVPGGAMGPSGQLRVTVQWGMSAATIAKTLRVRLGGLAGAVLHMRSNSGSTTVFERGQVQIANRGSETSQVGSANAVTGFNTATTAAYTSAIDTTLDQTLVITGQLAAVGESMTLDSYSVELLRPPT